MATTEDRFLQLWRGELADLERRARALSGDTPAVEIVTPDGPANADIVANLQLEIDHLTKLIKDREALLSERPR